MAMNAFRYEPGTNNVQDSFAVPIATEVDVALVDASTAETVTVPNGARFVCFAANKDFYLCVSGAAVVPVASVTDGTGSMLNPTIRSVVGVTTFSVIGSAADTIITMEWYI